MRRHIAVRCWTSLQAIVTARTDEELASLGFGVDGMDIALAGAKLECGPPIEFLQRLMDRRDSDMLKFDGR